MNKCFLVGNLTREPELISTGTSVLVCNFTIAINRNYTNTSGEKETDFINVTAWRGLGEICKKYLKKGSKVCVIGRIETRSYEVEGQKRFSTDIVADEVEFLSTPLKKDTDNDILKPLEEDDLPF